MRWLSSGNALVLIVKNLPEAHQIIQAMNLICRIVAPSVIFKSEAIVHPDDVRSYIDEYECQLSYNPKSNGAPLGECSDS